MLIFFICVVLICSGTKPWNTFLFLCLFTSHAYVCIHRYCHFVTESNPDMSYSAVDYLLVRAKQIQQPFMLYKMNTCLDGEWDKVYDAEMFTCLTSSANVQDMDAMAAYPSDMPDFSGSAGERTPVYPSCSRISSPASAANAVSPCTPLQMRRVLNHTSDADNAYLGLPPTRAASDTSTWGWQNLQATTKRIQNGTSFLFFCFFLFFVLYDFNFVSDNIFSPFSCLILLFLFRIH